MLENVPEEINRRIIDHISDINHLTLNIAEGTCFRGHQEGFHICDRLPYD